MADEKILLHVQLEGDTAGIARSGGGGRSGGGSGRSSSEDISEAIREGFEKHGAGGATRRGHENRILKAERESLNLFAWQQRTGLIPQPPIQDRGRSELRGLLWQQHRRRLGLGHGEQKPGDAAKLLSGEKASGATSAATAMGAAAVAATGLTLGMKAAGVAITSATAGFALMNRLMSKTAERLSEFSGSLAAATAQREVANIQARIRQADRIADELQDFLEVRTQTDKLLIEFQTVMIETFGPLVTGILKAVNTLAELFLDVEDDPAGSNQAILDFLNIDWNQQIRMHDNRRRNLRRPAGGGFDFAG